jgi:hypothetical protein
MTIRSLGCIAAAWLTLAAAAAAATAQEMRTLKERLSDKASDAQRVDNCKVPAERRGPVPRPDCAPKPRPPLPAVEAGPPSSDRR